MINGLIAITLLAGALSGLAGQFVIGAAGILLGAWNLINGIRLRIRTWIFFAVCWMGMYLGGHVVFAWWDPRFFSYYTNVWSLVFPALTLWILWRFGGGLLDFTIILAATPQHSFTQALGQIPARYFRVNPVLSVMRDLGLQFFAFVRFIVFVGMLLGLYFAWFPPSMNWRMFWVIVPSFIIYVMAGPGWDYVKWRKVAFASMAAAFIIQLATPWIKSYTIPVVNNVLAPTTSNYAVTVRDTTAWECSGCTESHDALSLKQAPKGHEWNTAAWMEVVDSTPQPFRGLQVILAKPAANPTEPLRSGFEDKTFLVPVSNVERRSSLVETTPTAATAITESTTSWTDRLYNKATTKSGMATIMFLAIIGILATRETSSHGGGH